jgi:hypothetical protein
MCFKRMLKHLIFWNGRSISQASSSTIPSRKINSLRKPLIVAGVLSAQLTLLHFSQSLPGWQLVVDGEMGQISIKQE